MKLKNYVLAACIVMFALPAFATSTPNPCGNSGNNCDTGGDSTSEQDQNQDQNQHQSNQQGQGQDQAQTASGTGVGYGGEGGTALSGSNSQSGATADVRTTIGPVGSTSGALSGSLSGASNGDQSTDVSNGSTSLSGSNSGGNLLSNGSASTASTGDQTVRNANDLSQNAISGATNGDVSGTNTSTTTSAGGTSSANGVVSVDAADRSSTQYNNSTRVNTFIPGNLPTNAMAIAPGAAITVAGDQTCGALATKVQIPVYQWDKKGRNKVLVGYDEDVAPYTDANGVQQDFQTVYTPDGGYYLRGSHVTYVLSTYGSSNSSQLGLQGGSAGGYGGLSYGSGRSYSQAGAKIIIRSCIADRVAPAPPVIEFREPRVPRG